MHQVVFDTFLNHVFFDEALEFLHLVELAWLSLIIHLFRRIIEPTSLSGTPLVLSAYMPSVHLESTFACFPMVTTAGIKPAHPVLEKLLFSH